MADSCIQNHYFSGQGSILLAERNASGNALGFTPVGNVTELKIGIETSVLEHKESCSGVRGIDKRLTQEVKATVSFTMENFSRENLSLALYGSSSLVAGATVTDEAVIAYLGKWSALANIQVSAVAVTGVGGTPTYVENTDYVVNLAAGSIMPLAAGSITEGLALEVDYAFDEQEDVQALEVSTAPERWVRFEGLNTAEENKPVVVDIYKFSTSPLSELGLINEELAGIALEGAALSDATKTTGSKYFRQRAVK